MDGRNTDKWRIKIIVRVVSNTGSQFGAADHKLSVTGPVTRRHRKVVEARKMDATNIEAKDRRGITALAAERPATRGKRATTRTALMKTTTTTMHGLPLAVLCLCVADF